MLPQTEQILSTLELLVESTPCIGLRGHEDGGYIYPFVWEVSNNGEFNAFNLSFSQGWLKLTDRDVVLKNWHEMKYLESFNAFHIKNEEKIIRQNKVTNLFQIINQNLQAISSFNITTYYSNEVGLIVGKTTDNNWIAVCHTLYKETYIPRQQIHRTEINQSSQTLPLAGETVNLIAEIEAVISDLGVISLQGDFGGGYGYGYDHKFVYGVAKTKEQAIEKALQKSGVLEISKFHSFYPDSIDSREDEDNYNSRQVEKYNKINLFFANKFTDVMMYRFSFWIAENIYIIGETQSGDRAGIYIESDFVYNP